MAHLGSERGMLTVVVQVSVKVRCGMGFCGLRIQLVCVSVVTNSLKKMNFLNPVFKNKFFTKVL